MRKIILTLFMIVACIVTQAQTLQTTIKVTGNKARIMVKAVGGNVVGQPSNFVFSVAIPAANSSASMTITTLDAAHLPTSLNSSGNYTDATYEYFNLTYTGAGGSTSLTFTSGVEYELIELNFTGSSQGPVTLVSLPDGNIAAPSVPGNWYNYLEVGGVGYSEPTLLFYQSANTLVPTQATTYSSGTAFVTTNVNVSLPVNMLNFSGYKNGGKNTLNWATSAEINNTGFDVQRSTDGVNYASIGFVNSLASGGASSSDISYTFDDNNPAGKKQYYRLNQKDIDGHSKLSNIVVINGGRPKILGIGGLFPNPARETINVIIGAPQREKVTLVVTDITGKTVKQQLTNVETGSNTVAVDIASLASGSYVIKVLCKSSDCEAAVGKFNKQ